MISFNINTYVTVCDPVCPMKSKGRTNSLPTLRGMAKWATTTSVMLQFYSCHKYRARGGMSVIYVWKRRVEFVAQQRARILKTFLPEKSQLSPIGRTNLSERGNFAFSRRLWPFFFMHSFIACTHSNICLTFTHMCLSCHSSVLLSIIFMIRTLHCVERFLQISDTVHEQPLCLLFLSNTGSQKWVIVCVLPERLTILTKKIPIGNYNLITKLDFYFLKCFIVPIMFLLQLCL